MHFVNILVGGAIAMQPLAIILRSGIAVERFGLDARDRY